MKMQEIRNDLQSICKAFKLGELNGYQTEEGPAEGYKTANFNTETGSYKYYFKTSTK